MGSDTRTAKSSHLPANIGLHMAVAQALLNEVGRRLAWAHDETLKNLIDEIYPGLPARWCANPISKRRVI